jgi:molecular chaperone GrpE
MDPNKEIEGLGETAGVTETDDSTSVDDFIRQLEAKEKDLHITANTTIIEIAESFDDGNLPEFLKEDLQIEVAKPAPAAAAPAPAKPPIQTLDSDKLEREVAELKDEVERIKAERDDLFNSSQRRAKDFENFKARTERERRETFKNQVGNLATQMLPALDNLNRAVDFALAMPEELRNDIQQFLDGVVLVNQQVNDVLAEMGVQPIATVGEKFDPHYHEAVATEESSEFDANVVSAELLRGYRLGERVIRHSMVKVAKGSSSQAIADEPQTEQFEVETFENETPEAEPSEIETPAELE